MSFSPIVFEKDGVSGRHEFLVGYFRVLDFAGNAKKIREHFALFGIR